MGVPGTRVADPARQGRPEPTRFLASGDEAGTAPEDRAFRPDVEGLRAIAVLAVVLFHAGLRAVPGGYIGVDVFFVISGFVITGVLLRERRATNGTSLLAFYGRRCRRIIPAATLVIVVAVLLAYEFGGFSIGSQAATDGRWAAVFLSNFHFASTGTNYLASQQAPSPVQNFWSLSVEEQFYLAYPLLFLVLAGRRGLTLRARLALGLVVVVCASFTFSVLDTAHDATGAYFSPLTRAWELALGALVAVATPLLLRVPARLGAAASWVGLGSIVVSALAFDARTAYPGAAVALPVVGAVLVIAGGMSAHPLGAEVVLGRAPFRGVGRISYSLYLWHWPILVVAADAAGKQSLPVLDNLGWVAVAAVAAVATYVVVENPIRHARFALRSRLVSVTMGAGLVLATLGAVAVQADVFALPGGQSGAASSTSTSASTPAGSDAVAAVERLVAVASRIKTVPAHLVPPLPDIATRVNLGFPPPSTHCFAGYNQSSVPACAFGDATAARTMVLYGDSHAAMWFQALDDLAVRDRWKLVILSKAGCPAGLLSTHAPNASGDWAACDRWHTFALDRIKALGPAMVIVTQDLQPRPDGGRYSATQWQRGLQKLLGRIVAPGVTTYVLGDTPFAEGPDCIFKHLRSVQGCAVTPGRRAAQYKGAESRAARGAGARYIDVTAWFCSRSCSPVIGDYDVYVDHQHLGLAYTRYLEGALAEVFRLRPTP
ncbi:MAG TPA: acyltransferase family protein [Acidimicrobiales bacterium]|nr:acyltransferase family protein [Acidimicrobiales bacterium]